MIEAIPDLSGRNWRPLRGGRTNATWLASSTQDNTGYVVKLYRRTGMNPMFPNDPFAEAEILSHLGGEFPAPELHGMFHTALGVCNVFRHIPGTTWTNDVSQVATLMARLHKRQAPSSLRRLPGGSEAIADHAQEIWQLCQNEEYFRYLRPRNVVAASEQRCLLHADIVPGNLICSETDVSLIDWQCPASGDPCEDIAVFLSPAMQFLYRGDPLMTEEIDDFFTAYGSPDLAKRFRSLAPWYHWRMVAYCQWQAENGRKEYGEAQILEVEALQRSLSA